MAACAALFLIMRRQRIIRCADTLNALVRTFQLDKVAIQNEQFRGLWWIQMYFYLVLVFGLVRFCMAIGNPNIFINFDDDATYSKIAIWHGPLMFYVHGTMLLSILLYYPVNTLFTYLAAFLVECTLTFQKDNEAVLKALKDGDPKIRDEKFVDILKRMRNHREQINSAFDDLQDTFSLKILLDVSGNVAVVLSAIAWFSIWGTDPSSFGWVNFSRHVLAALIYLMTVWVVGNQPVALYIQVSVTQELTMTNKFSTKLSPFLR